MNLHAIHESEGTYVFRYLQTKFRTHEWQMKFGAIRYRPVSLTSTIPWMTMLQRDIKNYEEEARQRGFV